MENPSELYLNRVHAAVFIPASWGQLRRLFDLLSNRVLVTPHLRFKFVTFVPPFTFAQAQWNNYPAQWKSKCLALSPSLCDSFKLNPRIVIHCTIYCPIDGQFKMALFMAVGIIPASRESSAPIPRWGNKRAGDEDLCARRMSTR